jgi:hypothetical protein
LSIRFPRTRNQGFKIARELGEDIADIEYQLDHSEGKFPDDDDAYFDWRDSALHALGVKRGQLGMLVDHLNSESMVVEIPRAGGQLRLVASR